MSPAVLPSASTQRPRTYLISGLLGVIFFTLSWVWWDGQSFVGSLFLELGGGAFIVFLLEVLLPSALGYADTALAALQVTTALEWSTDAVDALFAIPLDEAEQARLLAAIERGPYPTRPSRLHDVSDTGDRRDGHPVLRKALAAEQAAMHYYVSERRWRGRTVVIVDLRHHGDG